MSPREIQLLLDSGFRVGVTKPVDSAEYLGWILVTKHPPSPRVMSILEGTDETRLLEKYKQRERTPYLILNIELKRSVHEAGGYETEEDYRMKTQTWCKDLHHVQEVLKELGVELGQLRKAREIDAP